MNTPQPAVIETRALNKTYKNVTALHALDLCVLKHSIFGFLGLNGAGSPTTIKLLLGLLYLNLIFYFCLTLMPGYAALPVVATALWCLLFAALSVWRFQREEF